MPNRYICELDKDSAEDCGLTLKADLLGLRTLGAMGEAERLIQSQGIALDLERLPLDDPHIYAQMRAGATLIGISPIWSRAGNRICCPGWPRHASRT